MPSNCKTEALLGEGPIEIYGLKNLALKYKLINNLYLLGCVKIGPFGSIHRIHLFTDNIKRISLHIKNLYNVGHRKFIFSTVISLSGID